MALIVSLPTVTAYRITQRTPAVNLVAYTLAGLTSPQGIDSGEGLADVKAKALQNGSETIRVDGIAVTFTAQDFKTLSPRELRLKAFSAFADQLYDQGAAGLAESEGLDSTVAKQFQNDATLLKPFSATVHKEIGTLLLWMIIADVIVGSSLVLFSYRFGKIVSVGIVLIWVGLPGIVLGAIASQHVMVSGTARELNASSTTAAVGSFISYVAPLVLPYVAGVYLFVLKVGVALLGLATIGKVAYALARHKKVVGRSEQSQNNSSSELPESKSRSV